MTRPHPLAGLPVEMSSTTGLSAIGPSLADRFRISARYASLQGLRLVPLAILFLISAANRVAAGARLPHLNALRVWWFAGFAIALVLSVPIRRAYGRRFGHGLMWSSRTAWLTFLVIPVATGLAAAGRIRSPQQLPIVPSVISVLLLGHAYRLEGRRPYFLPLAALWILFTGLPRVTVDPQIHALARDLLIGLSLTVAGVGDHRLLCRTFAASRKDCDARTVPRLVRR